MFLPSISPGDIISNNEVISEFLCGNMGGMRRSHKTNTLTIISDPHKSLYDDRWDGNILYYTGMGKKGDQKLDWSQNKTLNESDTNGVAVHLFEVLKPKEYTYRGQVGLSGKPFKEIQLDANGENRDVWVFPLQVNVEEVSIIVPEEQLLLKKGLLEKKAQKSTLADLEKRALSAKGKPSKRAAETTQYERDPYVAEYVKKRAAGDCELCSTPAPFITKNGFPYLEAHHIVWLSEGGDDSVQNTVALCPNCHRKMHSLNLASDLKKLQMKATV